MPFAARQDDPLQHSMALSGAMVGLLVGAVVGSAILTGGTSLLVIGGFFTFSAGVGMGLGELAGSYFKHPVPTGEISTGSPDVSINSRPAVRATVDDVRCLGTPPVFIPPHLLFKQVAEGSETVFINGNPASRIDDRSECGATITGGSEDVIIGGPSLALLRVEGEMPLWAQLGQPVASVGRTLLFKGAVHAALEIAGAIAGDMVGGMIGDAVGDYLGLEDDSFWRGAITVVTSEAGGELGNLPGSTTIAPVNRWANSTFGLDPVDLGSGSVVDMEIDHSLPGPVPLEWRRHYSSARAHERTSLGRGGWALSLEQWILQRPGSTTFRDEEGRSVLFIPALSPGQSAFRRADRLTLTALEGGAFEVHSHDTRLTRAFAPLAPGGRAVLRAIRDAWGNAITLEYTGARLSRVLDAAGRELRVKRGPGDLVERVEVWAQGRLAQSVVYGYSARETLASAMNGRGDSQRYEFDDQYRLSRKTLQSGVSFAYAYDERTGWCRRVEGDGGIHTGELRIDPERRITYLTGTDEPRVLHWDERGLVVREETPEGVLIGAWERDADQLLLAETNGAGETTRYEYDARGNRIAATDPAGNVTAWGYERDLLVRRVDPGGLESRFLYDERGALRAVIEPSGRRVSIDHDERGRLVGVRDDDGTLAAYAHDERHDPIAHTDARGATTRVERDALGRPARSVDALGRIMAARHDALGNVAEVEREGALVARAERDALGRPTRVVDALGRSTRIEHAGVAAVTRLERPDGVAFAFRYTPGERLRRVEGPRGEAHEVEYDAAGRLVREATFDGRVIAYRWAAVGRLARIDYPDGSSRAFAHDRLGALVADLSPDGARRFERDREGRLLGAVAEQDGRQVRTRFERDRLGRVVAEHHGDRVIRSRHDARGRRVERLLPDGSITRYGHDAAGDLAWIEHRGARLVVERDVLGRRIALREAGGAFAVLSTHDPAGHLAEQRVEAGAARSSPARRTFERDAAGQLLRVKDARWGVTELRRDAAGRLLEVRRGRRREAFVHDASGALVRLDPGAPQAALRWEMAPGGLLREAGSVRYGYDARARRVHRAQGDAGAPILTSYSWDAHDRLREVRISSGARVRFTYDALGRRVRKEVDDPARGRRAVDYLWDGGVIAAEIDDAGRTRAFVHAPGSFEPLLQAEDGEVYTCVLDPLGAPSELLDRAGRVAWAAARGALGGVVEVHRDPACARPVEPPFRLPGQWYDEETGLCHALFRYFDPEVGRFCSPDPIGLAGGMDLSGLNADPTTHVDPLALCPVPTTAIPRTTPQVNLLRGVDISRGAGLETVPINVGRDSAFAGPINTGFETVPVEIQPPGPPVPASPDPAATVPLEIIGGH